MTSHYDTDTASQAHLPSQTRRNWLDLDLTRLMRITYISEFGTYIMYFGPSRFATSWSNKVAVPADWQKKEYEGEIGVLCWIRLASAGHMLWMITHLGSLVRSAIACCTLPVLVA